MPDPERWERLGRERAETGRARWTMDEPTVVEHEGVRWRQVEGLRRGGRDAGVRVEAYLATGPAVTPGEATVVRFIAGGAAAYGPRSRAAMAALRDDDVPLSTDADLDRFGAVVDGLDPGALVGWTAEYGSAAPQSSKLHVRAASADLVVGVDVDDRGRVDALDYGHAAPLAVERALDHDLDLRHDRLRDVGGAAATLPELPPAVADRTHPGTDRRCPTRVSVDADEGCVRLVTGPFPEPADLDAPLADEVVWCAFPDAGTADRVPDETAVDVVRPAAVEGDLATRLAARVDAAVARERGLVRERLDDVRDAVDRVGSGLDDVRGRVSDLLDDGGEERADRRTNPSGDPPDRDDDRREGSRSGRSDGRR